MTISLLMLALISFAAFGAGLMAGLWASRNLQAGAWGLAKVTHNEVRAARKDIAAEAERTRRHMARRL